MSNNGEVSLTVKEGIATVTFSHPQSNSLPGALLGNLASHIEEAGNNADAKVIVLQSGGEKTFCAGASFDELAAIETVDQGKIFFSGFAKVINAMRKAPKLVIARVQGKAVGGGVGLACAADYTMATVHASVKLSELAVGIGPFVVGPAVERKTGTAAFTQLTINATQWQTAEWAMSKGMYAAIFNTTEELDNAVGDLSNTLAASNPEAMMMLKKIMWQDTDNWDTLLMQRAEMSGKLVVSDFTRNAIASFKQGSR
jgi:methylglutaconyl-CoA hydratase